jgi:hypothetical protein
MTLIGWWPASTAAITVHDLGEATVNKVTLTDPTM